MKKNIIMSVAVMTSLLFGETMMAAVFGFVMLSGLMAGCFMNESARQVIECEIEGLQRVRPGVPVKAIRTTSQGG